MEHEQLQAFHGHLTFTTGTKSEMDILTGSLSPTRCVGSNNPNMRNDSANDSGRERLKTHRNEVLGRVVIPDKWSQEEMLKDWLDCGSFDALLAPKGFDLARAALVAERRQAKEAMESNSNAYIGMHYGATRCN